MTKTTLTLEQNASNRRIVPQSKRGFGRVTSPRSLVMTHLQTITIVNKLKLAWPDSAEAAMSVMVVNSVQLGARTWRAHVMT